MSKPIEGKVVEIIDKYRVIINVGNKDKVTKGMRFVILDVGHDIIDRTTGRNLGKLEFPKAEVKVIYVQEMASTAESAETRVEEIHGLPPSLFQPATYVLKELPVKPEEISARKIERTIKIGDTVKQIVTE